MSVHDYKLIYIECPGFDVWEQEPFIDDLRTDELQTVIVEGFDGKEFIVFYENKYNVRVAGIIGISRTLFICTVLSVGSIFFSSDANTLVLNPAL